MADPFKTDKNTLPEPHSTFAGVSRRDGVGKKAFAAMAKLWRPRGSTAEPAAATVSRYAMRLIDRRSGKAYSVDELKDGALATEIDVRDFGVDLSGNHDSTSEGQRAINEARRLGMGLYLPAGTVAANWQWLQQITIRGAGGCNVAVGAPNTVLIPAVNNLPVLDISGEITDEDALAGQAIYDLNIHGAGIGTSSAAAIKIGDGATFPGAGFYGRNVFIKEFAVGFDITAGIMVNLDNCSAPQCTYNIRARRNSNNQTPSTINVRGGGWGGLIGGGALDGITAFYMEHCFSFSVRDAEIGNCERLAYCDDSRFELDSCNIESIAGNHAIRAAGSQVAVHNTRYSRHSGPATSPLVRVSSDDSKVLLTGIRMAGGGGSEFANDGSLGAPRMVETYGLSDTYKKVIIAASDPGVVRVSSLADFSDNFGSNVITAVQWSSTVPTAANSHGVPSLISSDGSYLYVCTGYNTWKRAAIATW